MYSPAQVLNKSWEYEACCTPSERLWLGKGDKCITPGLGSKGPLMGLSAVNAWASDIESKRVEEDSSVNSISTKHHAWLKHRHWSKHTHAQKPHTVQSFQCQTPLQPIVLTRKKTIPLLELRSSVWFTPLSLKSPVFFASSQQEKNGWVLFQRNGKITFISIIKVLLIWRASLNTVGTWNLAHWPSLYPSQSEQTQYPCKRAVNSGHPGLTCLLNIRVDFFWCIYNGLIKSAFDVKNATTAHRIISKFVAQRAMTINLPKDTWMSIF